MRHIDIAGQRFGMVVAIKRNGCYKKGRIAMCLIECDCGNTSTTSGNSLRMGKTKSCGCQSIKALEKGRIYFKGKKRPEISGENCHLWRGGITTKNVAIRKSLEYKQWRTSVFERDNYICVECKKVGGSLNADHIKEFSNYPHLRFDINNGRTLCLSCHTKTDNYGEKAKQKRNLGLLA